MSLVPVAEDIINVRVHCYNQETNQASVNDFGYVIDDVTGLGANTYQRLCDALDVLIAPLWKPCIANAAEYRGLQVEVVDPGPYPATPGSVIGSGAGTGGPTQVPDQMAALIRRRTEQRGPSERGRVFMPFLPTSFMDASGELDLGAAGLAYYPLMQLLFGTAALGGNDVGILTVTSATMVVYTLVPCLIHRVPKPGVSTESSLSWVALEKELGGLRKRGDWGQMNRPFEG